MLKFWNPLSWYWLFCERKETEKQAWSLGQTVGGGGVEDVAGSN